MVGAYGKNSNTGAAYIFERNQGGAENWGQVKKLTASDAAVNDQFGRSVAIDVDTVVVGAWLKNSFNGAAYIFERNQGGAENWGQVKKLTASDAAGGDEFGSSVSINADTVVVGAWVKNSNTGAAYIFERNQGGAENWGQVQKLTANDAVVHYFGYSVSINGDAAVVGAYGKQPGAAYIFERNRGGAEHWGQVKNLTASDGIGGDQFGISVAINIDTVAVGANHGNRGTSGAVYIFERNQGGVENWGQVKELTADDAALLDEFGISVAIDGDTLVVGAWAINLLTGGAAYIFERNQNGVEGWGEVQKLTASDAAAHDQFGTSVGIDGDTIVIGAVGKNSNTGAAYTFDLTPTPSPTPTANVSCGFTANLGSPPAPATTGTMTTRLYRGDAQGTCSTNPFPGNTGSGSFPFDAYTLTNSSPLPVCVSAALTVNSKSNANYQIAAFLAPFVATDITNPSRYLGDPGISNGTPEPLITSFQFTVPGNTSFAIVVFSVNGTAELGGSYTFQVMSTSSFCPAPTPAATPPATKGTAVAYQIDATHSGAQFDTIVPPLAQRWSRDLGSQISYPLIVNGRIFVTVSNPSTNGSTLYALDEASGASMWGPIDLGGSRPWSNAAYEAGRVFALNYDGLLRAFDAASGALLWSKQLPDQYAFWSPPTASGGVVYVGGFGHGTTLYAVNEQDGTVNWSVLVDAGNDSSPAVTPTGVFVSYDQVYDFSPQDGSLIWFHSGPSSTPVLFGGRLYVGDPLTETWMFDAPTGALLGTFPAGPPPAFSGSTGFFLTGSILKARDAYSGAVRWSFTGDGTLTSAPIVDNGYVYIGSRSGKVYALDGSTGANVWTGNLGAVVQTTESPVSRPHTGLGAGDGLVVVPASTLLVAYQSQPTPTPTPTPTPAPNVVQFSSSSYSVVEACTTIAITVNRSGDTSAPASVDYVTSDGTASERRDYNTALGRLNFAAGETSKSFVMLINSDSYVEGTETFNVTLNNPIGATLGTPSIATVQILDSPPAITNAIDDPQNYVCQHYHDFLNRQPDSSGLAFWTNVITSCGTDQQCLAVKHVDVSAAFYLSIEFQETGYLVERLNKTAYGDLSGTSTFGGTHLLAVPIVRFNEFMHDSQQIGQGVVVGQTGWETTLENNKQSFVADFVTRSKFASAFPSSITAAQFVDRLNANAGNPLSTSERDRLVSDLLTNAKTRAQVLRTIAEHRNLVSAEFNRGFVLMQFFGYLRRNPDDPQDTDYTGYDFWLTKLNNFNGNYQNAEMVKVFITSTEYRRRFGP